MTKKIFLVVVCFIVLFSCGRKADPEYKVNHYKIIIHKV